MNQLIAIMKDSYREARSTWVLHAMLILSGLMLLIIASISFRLVTLEEALGNHLVALNIVTRGNPTYGHSQYLIENMKASNPSEPWNSDYDFDVVIRADSPEGLEMLKKSGLPTSRTAIREILKEKMVAIDKYKISEVPRPAGTPAKEICFHVTTTGIKTPDRLSWQHEPSIFFGIDLPYFTDSLREGVYRLEKRGINDGGGWLTIFISIIVTAGFIPGMLGKSTLDLYISKPITRFELLFYKYLGGMIFVLLVTSITVCAMWIVIGLRSGIWTPHLLAMIPMVTFYFAILYSISTLIAVLTRSSLLAILVTAIVWGLAFGFGWLNAQIIKAEHMQAELKQKLREMNNNGDEELPPEFARQNDFGEWIKIIATVGHGVLPRNYDLDDRMIRIIADGLLTEPEKKQMNLDWPLPPAWQTFGFSLLFIAVMLSLAMWRFCTRDG